MAKSKKTLTTNEAVERLLGKKAAKRLRKLAIQNADEKARPKASKTKTAKKR